MSVVLVALVALVAWAGDADAQQKAREQVGLEKSGQITVDVAAHLGVGDTYELAAENDDGERREAEFPASPTVGFGFGVDYKITDLFAIGAEAQLLWVELEDDGDRRLHAHPMARVRLAVPVASDFVVDAVVALGMAIWEGDDETGNRDFDEVTEERIGLGMRFGFGVAWVMHPSFATYASATYSLGLTPKDDITATFGAVLFSLGGRTSFGF